MPKSICKCFSFVPICCICHSSMIFRYRIRNPIWKFSWYFIFFSISFQLAIYFSNFKELCYLWMSSSLFLLIRDEVVFGACLYVGAAVFIREVVRFSFCKSPKLGSIICSENRQFYFFVKCCAEDEYVIAHINQINEYDCKMPNSNHCGRWRFFGGSGGFAVVFSHSSTQLFMPLTLNIP